MEGIPVLSQALWQVILLFRISPGIIYADISLAQRMFALKHELALIYCVHFETDDVDTEEQEVEADRMVWVYYDAYKAGNLAY